MIAEGVDLGASVTIYQNKLPKQGVLYGHHRIAGI